MFPTLKHSTAAVFKYYVVVGDTLITDQAHKKVGNYTAELTCAIAPGGATCGRVRKVIHPKAKGISTSNLISHLSLLLSTACCGQ